MAKFDAEKEIAKVLIAALREGFTELQYESSQAIITANGTFKTRGELRFFSMAWDFERKLTHFRQGIAD